MTYNLWDQLLIILIQPSLIHADIAMSNLPDPPPWFRTNAFTPAMIQSRKCLPPHKMMINWICNYSKRWKSKRILGSLRKRRANDDKPRFDRIEQQVLSEKRPNHRKHKYRTKYRVRNAINCFKRDRKCNATNGFTGTRRSRARCARLGFICKRNWTAIDWVSMPNKRNICARNVARVLPVVRGCGNTIGPTMKAKQCHIHAENATRHSRVGPACSYIWEFIRVINRLPARKLIFGR